MKKLLGIAALTLCSGAHAAPVEIWATYTGFFNVQKNMFDSTATKVMHAVVDDYDGNGAYSFDEVIGFTFGATAGDAGPCDPYYTGSFNCLRAFSYTPGGDLTFAAEKRVDYRHQPYESVSAYVVSGVSYSASGGPEYARWSKTLRWTPETAVSISPVPEPATITMLIGGLAVMGFALRRRH